MKRLSFFLKNAADLIAVTYMDMTFATAKITEI